VSWTYLRNCRRFSFSVGSRVENRMRTPAAGALRITTPFSAIPFTHILPLATQSPISTFASPLIWFAVSTWHPPMLVLERFPHSGARASLTCSSTATKHLILGCRRLSCPQVALKMSGSNGGVAEAAVGTGWGGGSAVPFDLLEPSNPVVVFPELCT